MNTRQLDRRTEQIKFIQDLELTKGEMDYEKLEKRLTTYVEKNSRKFLRFMGNENYTEYIKALESYLLDENVAAEQRKMVYNDVGEGMLIGGFA